MFILKFIVRKHVTVVAVRIFFMPCNVSKHLVDLFAHIASVCVVMAVFVSRPLSRTDVPLHHYPSLVAYKLGVPALCCNRMYIVKRID